MDKANRIKEGRKGRKGRKRRTGKGRTCWKERILSCVCVMCYVLFSNVSTFIEENVFFPFRLGGGYRGSIPTLNPPPPPGLYVYSEYSEENIPNTRYMIYVAA